MVQSSVLPSALSGLTDAEYTVGGVRFFIDLIPAKPATPIFRAILHELQHVDFGAIADGLSSVEDDDMTRIGLSLLHELTRIRPEFISWLESELFEFVRFQTKDTMPHVLAGSEDMAFAKLTVFDLHEVLVRSLARNFFGQFSVYRSRRGGAPPPTVGRL